MSIEDTDYIAAITGSNPQSEMTVLKIRPAAECIDTGDIVDINDFDACQEVVEFGHVPLAYAVM